MESGNDSNLSSQPEFDGERRAGIGEKDCRRPPEKKADPIGRRHL